VHIVDKNKLNMYAPNVDENFLYTMGTEVVNKQLLINYCFGHSESTKLLCPIGSGTAFINHSPTPNAAIRWSTHESSALHKEEWLNMTVEQMGQKLDVGLMIEYYALREMAFDEEITINYGLEWEKAWDEHVNGWQPTVGAEEYVSAQEMNRDPEKWVLTTINEQEESPYPLSIVTSCFYELDDTDGYHDDSGLYADPHDFDVIVKKWKAFEDTTIDLLFLRPCIILERVEVTDVERMQDSSASSSHQYTVQILNSDKIHDVQKIPDYELLVVEGFPRESIMFTDFAYSSDMHLKNSFRHEMIMPDGLFPNTWRNLKQYI
jgi:SET domain